MVCLACSLQRLAKSHVHLFTLVIAGEEEVSIVAEYAYRIGGRGTHWGQKVERMPREYM